ncbi:MAG: UbiD family decarboxylase [Archaeoglobaceae archaeon]|nr:UbiD family decarboxylase [Archaeoglobaceae archaeon]MDW8117402.1 UbiD family decarboxylase [Archaeoglobaceae archaeon]
MDLRTAIEVVRPKVSEKELRHYEVLDFLKKNGLLDKPIILNVEGKKVAKNLVSSRELLATYLGMDPNRLAIELAKAYERDAKLLFKDFSELNLNKRRVNLFDLPIIKYFPEDRSRYITGGVVIAKREHFNASIHRMMLIDEKSLAIRLVAPRHTYLMWRDAVEHGEDLKIAVCIGVHPLFLLASATRVGIGEEFSYASKLMNGLTLYKREEMLFPESEIILFGRITPETVEEGPFVDITGTYDEVRKEPLVVIDEIYAKEDAIYYSITPGGMEHRILMGVPYEPVIYRFVSNVCKVKNVATTSGSRNYFHAVVQIEKKTDGDAKNAIIAALSANPSLKGVIVVDDDIDIFSYEDIDYAVATRFQADRDLVIVKGARGSSLDPSSDETTTKWGIDATKPLKRAKEFERVIK